jgi:lipid kinase YegS
VTGEPRHIRLILHGKAAARSEVRAAVEAVRADGHRVEVDVTWEAGDSERMAARAVADEVESVVAGGGDGTLNEVATGVVKAGATSALGLLPLGTANDFAHACGIPVSDPLAALRIVAETAPTPIDYGVVGERGFLNVATGGFGTRITVETPAALKRRLGGAAYLLTGLRRFDAISAERGSARGPEFAWEGSFYALAVGNGRQAGGGIPLCPDALLDDGLLDVVILPDIAEERRFEVLGALMRGGLAAVEKEAIQARVAWLEVSVPSGLYVNLDGEPTHATRYRFEVRPRGLRMHLPTTAPLVAGGGDQQTGIAR